MTIGLIAALASAAPAGAQTREGGVASVVVVGYVAFSFAAIKALTRRQSVEYPAPGSAIRIRTTTAPNDFVLGWFRRYDGGSIAFDAEGATLRMARSRVLEIDVNTGSGNRWAEGWRAGLIGGAVSGALLGYASVGDQSGSDERLSPGGAAIFLGTGLGVLGSIGGAIIGRLGPDRWVRATAFGDQSRLSIIPAFATPGIAARIVF